ncbi:sugar phosphate isomerase/epimerase family protein [[Mycobacterium] wendilense]|uniref:TIM barrel protein n=1 Tax=[Mycobacterium] wendilense TaxID=3064284 RepID=A0ABN9P2V9_9MYCO|nr:TIM barrel protein [Mycolicibacterium sp. MU0050]CAJ1583362.1 TIM barrel protein [Mycolicibacterium sp. MU0050]
MNFLRRNPPGRTAGRPSVRQVSLAPLTVLEFSPPQMVTCAAEAGYDAVGLRLIPATDAEPRHPSIGTTPMIRETRQRLDDTGLSLLDIEVLRLRPDTRVREEFGPFLETGAYLGAREVLVTGNDPDHHRLADNLAELSEFAGTFGVVPNLEPMPWTDVRDLREAASILRRCEQRQVGLLVDALHYDRTDATAADLQALAPNWIRYIQICDGTSPRPTSLDELQYQGRNARLFPGEGSIDLVAMLRSLPGVPISIEAPIQWRAPAVVRARAALRAARPVIAVADSDRVSLSA